MNTVLVIAYYFPPLGLSGVQRTLKFVKYLPSFGWKPIVLTVDGRGYFAKDESLLDELEGLPVTIERVSSRDPLSVVHQVRKADVVKMPSGFLYRLLGRISQSIFIPDNKIGWRKRAVQRALEIIDSTQVDAIYSTAPPFTDFLIARDIKKHRGIPLLIDYRDAWLRNPLHFYPTPIHRILHRRRETSVLRYADRVVTINRRIKELMVGDYPNVTHHDIEIIPHGFDAEDFAPTPPPRRPGRMVLAHAGTFYYNRTPVYFLKALTLFFERQPEARKHVEAHFYGVFRDEDRRRITKLGLDNEVVIHGYVPHRECTRELQQADVLWMMIGNDPGDDLMSTGKLYDYLGARRPVLACVPEGVARQALAPGRAAFFCPPDDPTAIADRIAELHTLWKRGALPVPDETHVMKFERRHLTGQLARALLSLQDVDPGIKIVNR